MKVIITRNEGKTLPLILILDLVVHLLLLFGLFDRVRSRTYVILLPVLKYEIKVVDSVFHIELVLLSMLVDLFAVGSFSHFRFLVFFLSELDLREVSCLS